MNEHPRPSSKGESNFAGQVGAKSARKLRARRRSDTGVWLGLGMMGLIGWSVVVPTLVGAAMGLWLDKHHAGRYSWTLALMTAGLAIGCLNAWHWVEKQDRTMQEEEKDDE